MNLKHLITLALLLPHAVYAATITGTLVDGGGVDDMSIVVKGANGKTVTAYCGPCDVEFDTDKDDVQSLKKEFVGRKVILVYKSEKNNDRIAGPGEDFPLLFVKKLTFLK